MKIFFSVLLFAGAACIIAGCETSATLTIAGIIVAVAATAGAAAYTKHTNPEEFEREWKWD